MDEPKPINLHLHLVFVRFFWTSSLRPNFYGIINCKICCCPGFPFYVWTYSPL